MMLRKKRGSNVVLSSMIGTVAGLAVGTMVIMMTDNNPVKNFFNSMKSDAQTAFKNIENNMNQA